MKTTSTSNQVFTKEQAVEFSGPKNRTMVGVIVDGPSGKHDYYNVRCTDGNSFKVAAVILKPAKLSPADRSRLFAAGQSFTAKRNEHREAKSAKREQFAAIRGQQVIDFHGFARGQIVKCLSAAGQPEVMILKVLREEGKCVISNWKAQAHRELLAMGFNSGKNPKASVTVYADRLVPAR